MSKKYPGIEKVNLLIFSRDQDFLGLFGNRKGEDEPYLEFLKTQPCKNCGAVPHYEMDLMIYNIPAHVRRVNKGSGTGIKPQWNATTLCNDCHQKEHRHGQASLAPCEQFDKWADESLVFYVATCLRENLGFNWMEKLEEFLDEYMPGYRSIQIQ